MQKTKLLRNTAIGIMGLVAMFISAGAANDISLTSPADQSVSQAYVESQLQRLDLETLSQERYDAVMEASKYAYMDLETARSTDNMEKILEARDVIIFSQGWVADGYSGCELDEEGNVVKVMPEFHDLFPESWNLPTFSDDNTELIGSQNDLESYPYATNATPEDGWYVLYQGSEFLRIPSSTADTPPFYSFETSPTGFKYYINKVSTVGYYTVGQTYNIGYENVTNNTAIGWDTFDEGRAFQISVPRNITVAIRASTYDSPGEWGMHVNGYFNYSSAPNP